MDTAEECVKCCLLSALMQQSTLVGLEPTTFESLLWRSTRSPTRYPLRHRATCAHHPSVLIVSLRECRSLRHNWRCSCRLQLDFIIFIPLCTINSYGSVSQCVHTVYVPGALKHFFFFKIRNECLLLIIVFETGFKYQTFSLLFTLRDRD